MMNLNLNLKLNFRFLKLNLVCFSIFLLSIFTITACGRGSDYRSSKPNVELLQDMMAGPQIKAQEGSESGGKTVRTPPAGVVPRGQHTPEDMTLEDAEKLSNPLKYGEMNAELSMKYENAGQEKYNINCAVCHGVKGDGLGILVEKKGDLLLKKPPSLLTDTYQKYSDSRLYYVITYGWGLMGNYGTQITNDNERWAVVNYVRELQKQNSAKSTKVGE